MELVVRKNMDWLVSDELKNYICEGFILIKRSENFSEKQKIELIDRLLSMGAGVGWRPKAITINALQLFVQNDFKRPAGIERSHIHHRRDTLNDLLKREWKNDEWWDWYKERDYTILSTRQENRNEKDFPKIKTIDIPLEKNLFLGQRVGYVYGSEEKVFLKEIASKLELIIN